MTFPLRAQLETPRDEVEDLLRGVEGAVQVEQAHFEEAEADFFEWALRVPEPKGTLDFSRFPFQPEIYRALGWCREGVVKKGTQVGISAFLARWAMFGADTRGITALYVFPTKTHVYDFADARIRPLIRNSPYLRSKVPWGYVQNKGLKQVGRGYVYFRGSESKNDLDSVDADWLALDEYDTLKQENIPDAERRIGGSLDGKIRRIGVPSIPNYGIAKRFDESDQREWLVKCPACGEWQEVRFFENVEWMEELPTGETVRLRADEQAAEVEPSRGIIGDTFRVCEKCRASIDEAISHGEWVAKYPHRVTPGFHPTRLLVPRANLKEIVEASKQREPFRVTVFYNKDLGEPYASDENRLSLTALHAAQREFAMVSGHVANDNYVTMGIDVASKRMLNVRISEHLNEREKKALWIGVVRSFNDLPRLMRDYCLAPETRVLYDDLSWRALGEAKVGDRVLAFDEEPPERGRDGQRRCFRVASIESCERITRPCYRVTFEDGREVVASQEHLWLAGHRIGPRQGYRRNLSEGLGSKWESGWISTMDLRPGTQIRDLGRPWVEDTSRDGGYLAGAFDGEGTLRSTAGFELAFSQKPGAVMDGVVALLNEKGFRITDVKTNSTSGVATVSISGAHDTLSFIGRFRPRRFLEKVPGWIDGRLAAGTGRRAAKGTRVGASDSDRSYAVVASVEFLGDREVVAVGTTTKTLFAEGLFSHNSVNMAVIDHLPEYRLARSFAAMFPGRVFICAYTATKMAKPLVIKTETWEATVRRTEAIDAMLEGVRSQRNFLPVDWPEGYTAHMQAMYRKVSVDDKEVVTVEYVSTGPDDYAHAETFDLVADEVYWAVRSIEQEQQPTYTQLDEMLEFERSTLDQGDPTYATGFEDWDD